MENTIQIFRKKIDYLETELNVMRRTFGVTMEKKDSKAWDRLHIIGKEIARDWKSNKPSWQLVSESRR
jgi:hypothetical protein